jgi:guanine nucleotide-binding protein G(i) subunit alpha
MSSPPYLPIDHILRGRMEDTMLNLGELLYQLLDAGGAQSERKKWVDSFENVTASCA